MAPGRGSLAEVLPDSVRQLFNHAATAFAECAAVGWAGPSGRPFEWRICRVPDALAVPASGAALSNSTDEPDHFGELAGGTEPLRQSVTQWVEGPTLGEESSRGTADGAIVGTLVHRLFQHAESRDVEDPAADGSRAAALLTAEERATLVDAGATIAAAANLWRQIRARADVAALLSGGRRLYEVPFSVITPPSGDAARVVLRGTIDCLVIRDDGTVVVIEFKTGRPRQAHVRQIGIYEEAARAMFPGARVEAKLIYATEDGPSA